MIRLTEKSDDDKINAIRPSAVKPTNWQVQVTKKKILKIFIEFECSSKLLTSSAGDRNELDRNRGIFPEHLSRRRTSKNLLARFVFIGF